MSEYWKSTPKYWCKHCSIYVRDTKLERQNHEATGKHQGALKRFLRDLHRGHEQEEREKERAKREVERLKGIAPGSSASSFSGPPSYARPGSGAAAGSSTEAQRKQQIEQLAAMGVSVPTEFRGDMAMAGEWTVTATKVIDDDDDDARREKPVEAKAVGVRKREQTEEEKEEEEAVRGLFKKPRRWGGTKTMPEEDADLDALLGSSTLLRQVKKKEEEEEEGEEKAPTVKEEEKLAGTTDLDNAEEGVTEGRVKTEEGARDAAPGTEPDVPSIKREPTEDGAGKGLDAPALDEDAVKKEDQDKAVAPAVVFKKRKPKNMRQK
ncbi:hypothetical protein LX32DRAFT_639443 [Colletotrichum zoysiae]|uniref:U1-type domain-containing protein n=1 Tax=Colletotrichum zoysiae TaxID=1216348 RepID=A0AAD9HHL8_9PEZI|nr:hypothetical protein LX32DRAFT_639443 [Colletotrichum zoysiae]